MIDQVEFQTVVVAGCSSGVGKTSVAEAVTLVLADHCRAGAAKITVTHGERGCPHGGKGCNVCSSLGGDFQLIVKESVILQSGTDTCRLSAAGANPVVWAITRDTAIKFAWEEMTKFFVNVDCVVLESNTITEHIDPSLTLMVVDASVSRKIWKPSAERLIASANYVIFNNRGPVDKRKELQDEIETLRGTLDDVIIVSHPDDVFNHAELMQNLKSRCLER